MKIKLQRVTRSLPSYLGYFNEEGQKENVIAAEGLSYAYATIASIA